MTRLSSISSLPNDATDFPKTDKVVGKSFLSKLPFSRSRFCTELESGPIIEKFPLQLEASPLKEGFTWSTLDITNDVELNALYVLLRDNYVEDVSSSLRFDYSKEFLRWCLTGPGWVPEFNVSMWHNTSTGKRLVGYINAVPTTIRVDLKAVPMVIGDFLCIHKDYRNIRMTPRLVNELIRRANIHGINQAVLTSGKNLMAAPIGSFKFYHRPINVKKLLSANYWYLEQGQV